MTQQQLNKQLFEAVLANNIEAVRRSIDKGADVKAKNKYGKTPLRLVSPFTGSIQTAELLKQHGGVI